MSKYQYTESQQSFIHHSLDKDQHVRVIAGPGSGKTTTLLARVRYLLTTGVPASRILILAFNRSIKNQFENKLSGLLFAEGIHSALPDIRTFHSWGQSLTYDLFNVCPDRSLILSHEPVSANSLSVLFKGIFSGGVFRNRGIRVVQKNKNLQINAQQVVDAIPDMERDISDLLRSWPRQHELIEHCVSVMTTYRNMIGVINDMREKKPAEVPHGEWDELVGFVARVDEYLVAQGVSLFEDQLYRAAMYLTRSERALEYLQNRYDYILVDEFQDVSEVSQFLVVNACRKHCQLNAVGDPRQSIFEFAGADPAYLIRGIDQALGHITTYYLSESFRFGQHIAGFANKIARNLLISSDTQESDELFDDPFLDDVPLADIHNAEIIGLKPRDAAWVERSDQQLMEITAGWLRTNKSVVYIVRTHDQKVDVEAFLVRAGLHFKHNAAINYKALSCVTESLMYILNCWVENRIRSERPSFWRYAEGPALNPAALADDTDDITVQFEGFVRSFLLTDKLKAVSPSQTMLNIYERIYEEFLRECITLLQQDAGESSKEQLVPVMADRFVRTIYSRYEDQLSEIQEAENYIHVEVAHRVKGLEFDKVVLFDFSEGVFPFARRHAERDQNGIPYQLNLPDYIEQEQRLAFVAATRAKEELVFYIPSDKAVSRFITQQSGYDTL
ncbi:UvrD-helicase domain-containing protein [Oceanospirillum sediminis]|uniref:DNA 3'-5' helicase n=1 Tax=Oceanospirillum sediminis TaxID=2760088 RepID=A0A839ISP2_9GAMM|nr:ATP-dependent helicase [Oceanospirillum sediminis]MBB1487684.1 ATP-dependent helicase [Oceanospirillum sediminis]